MCILHGAVPRVQRFGELTLLSAIVPLLACGGSATTSVTSPSPAVTRCQPSFDATPRAFAASGGTSSIAVTVARECPWSASSAAGWVAITAGAQGQGDGSVTFNVAGNPEPIARQGTLTIGDGRLELTQQPLPCRFEVSRPLATIAPAGGALPVQVRTHGACDWSAASEVSWVTVAPSAGRGNGDVILTFSSSDGGERSGSVVVAGERLSLTQTGAPAAPPPSPPPAPAPPAPPSPAPPPPAPPPPPPAPPPPPPGPPPTGEVRLSGSIRQLSGRCPSVSFTVENTLVTTDRETRFKGGKCSDLDNRDDVEVKGVRLPDGSVSASEVRRD